MNLNEIQVQIPSQLCCNNMRVALAEGKGNSKSHSFAVNFQSNGVFFWGGGLLVLFFEHSDSVCNLSVDYCVH